MKLCLLFSAMLLGACSCTPTTSAPADARDPSLPAPIGTTDCDRAESRLRQLGCSQAASPKGVPFAQSCRDAAETGVDLGAKCIAAVTRCEDVEAASRGCAP